MSTEQQVVIRSWMRQRPGESARAFRYRLSHSCYRCGWFCPDLVELDEHEDHRDCPQRS